MACLAYTASKDGLGAQVLRVLQIIALSKHCGLDFKYKPIQFFEGNFGDGFENQSERDDYVNSLDDFFEFHALDCGHTNHKFTIYFPRLIERLFFANRVIPRLLKLFRWFTAKVNIEMIIRNPEAIVARNAEIYKELDRLNILKEGHIPRKTPSNIPEGVRLVCVHIRRGVGALPLSRFQSTNWYLRNLKTIVNYLSALDLDFRIIIHTDAPRERSLYAAENFSEESLEFMIKIAQIDKDVRKLKYVEVSPESFEESFFEFPNLEIKRGLKPLEVWEDFLQADFIILGKSTFSAVPSLLNRHAVVIKPYGLLSGRPEWLELDDSEGLNIEQLDKFGYQISPTYLD